MNLERFWAVYADTYDRIWDSPATAATRAVVQLAIGPAATVVDLGCGTGLMSAGLASRGVKVIGVDSSARMLGLAARRVSATALATADDVPLATASADAVIIGNLLHLHPDPPAVLAEARRLVVPGGVIVATWPVPGLTPGAMLLADLRSGRSLGASLRAHLLRIRIGLLAARTQGTVAARARGAHDTRALWLDPAQRVTTVAHCQQVVVLHA